MCLYVFSLKIANGFAPMDRMSCLEYMYKESRKKKFLQ